MITFGRVIARNPTLQFEAILNLDYPETAFYGSDLVSNCVFLTILIVILSLPSILQNDDVVETRKTRLRNLRLKFNYHNSKQQRIANEFDIFLV